MKKKLLLRLAGFLEIFKSSKKLKWNMDKWHTKDKCGTVCCAWGLAFEKGLIDPKFCQINESFRMTYVIPNNYSYIIAGENFGLDKNDAEFIFDPTRYKSENPRPKTVAKRIRELVKQHS